ncbi:acylneuraminate cytidylyltransferase [Sneathiella chinensis]|uniref:N-acylneuraminate cytidylyltransferase n=1 Tax=Sneathiella chinensis TaxID=349750 RepID=A0ABQ5U3A5_9PROT|nr:acylneuraminate cytidylyltransferase [Sneathiella chinensis]GLQ05754.1 transferase [Sneathiella chinensis]
MNVVAIIPARGGSKGIPGKNKKLLGGLPLISHTIRAAQGALNVGRVYVSSDDDEILAIAAREGAVAVRRPDALATDEASSETALLDCLEQISGAGPLPDYIAFLQCTSPFVTSAEIEEVVQKGTAEGVDSAFSAVPDHAFLWQVGSDGLAEGVNHNADEPRKRRQDLPAQFRENGAIYVMKTGPFLRERERFCGNTVVVPVKGSPLELDTLEDWDNAEKLMAIRASSPDRQAQPSGLVPQIIRTVVMDFDGVHTDNRVYVSEAGVESVVCSRDDGFGVELLRKSGFRLLILSKERNPVVRLRAEKLKVEVMHGVDEKEAILSGWLSDNNLDWKDVAYIGNDLNDLDCIRRAALGFCPADAHLTVRNHADHVLKNAGGSGAIREMAELLLDAAR